MVRQATVADLELLVPLFDGYPQFLLDRFKHNQSVIFIAFADQAPVGFTQLYPSFPFEALARIFALNDLIVLPSARRLGIGAALLTAAAEYAHHVRALRLVLSTELTNSTAQALHEKLGWKRNTDLLTYQWIL